MAATALQKFLLSVLVLVGMTSVVAISQVTIAELTSYANVEGEAGDRPHRLRTEDREELREEHRAAEDLGREVERIREWADDTGTEITIEEARNIAEEKLWEAVGNDTEATETSDGNTNIYDQFDSLDGFSEEAPRQDEEFSDTIGEIVDDDYEWEPERESHRVCFRSDGSVTEVREECDMDQGRHFGMPPPGMHEFEGGDFEERIEEHYEFRPQMHYQGPPVLDIVADALHNLSGMLRELRGTEKEAEVREAIAYLSQVLSHYAGSDPHPNESMQIAQEIHGRLSDLMQSVGGGYGMPPPGPGQYDEGYEDQPMMGGHEPDFSQILSMMDCMMRMAGQVLEAFDEFGIPVEPSAREAYKKASARYAEVRPACEKDRNACMELRGIGDLLENEMRPPMEKAMMSSPQSMEVVEKVMSIVDQCDMGPPEHMGPRDDMGPRRFENGMPQRFENSMPPRFENGMPPRFEKGMPQGFPQGMHQGFPQGMQQGFPQGMQQGCPDREEIERMYLEKSERMRKEMAMKGVDPAYVEEVIARMKGEMFRFTEECENREKGFGGEYGTMAPEPFPYKEHDDYPKYDEEYKDYGEYNDYNESQPSPNGLRPAGNDYHGAPYDDGCPTKEDISWTLQKMRDEMIRFGKSPEAIEKTLQYKEEELFTAAANCAAR